MKHLPFISLLLISLISACGESLDSPAQFETQLDSVAYSVGMDIARFYQKQEVELDPKMLYMGFRDVMAQQGVKLSEEEAMSMIQVFREEMTRKEKARMALQAAEQEVLGQKFLEENRNSEGVVELPSGLQYRVITAANEGQAPSPEATVQVNYISRLIDGSVYDSSERLGGPAEFQVNRVIPGWTEALTLMKPGAKWELFIPAELAYGRQGRSPSVPPNAALIFELELVSIVSDTQ
ncbi:MAG: FKBP-type peptidyl-prolyl cis-trans isomerase [Bacteroidota bacterium]